MLGKVWGFLKYYLPAVAKGNYNWDFELFRMLPKYINTTSKPERDQILQDWISKYGKIDECIECKQTTCDAFIKPDLSWFNAHELNPDLKDKLKFIYHNRSPGKHYYIDSKF